MNCLRRAIGVWMDQHLMLEQAGLRLSRFDGRVKLGSFDLADCSWRKLDQPVQAVVSSLAIHHLDGEGKQSVVPGCVCHAR